MPGITIRDLLKNNNNIYKLIFRLIKKKQAVNIEKHFDKIGEKQLPEMRITHNISSIDIHVNFSARIYSAISLKTRVVLSSYPILALIDIGVEICLISKKIANKISIIYILNRRIAIINASKGVTYIEEIYNSQEIIYRKIKINMPFIIININTHDVILKILYILITRINIYIKEEF